jgi:hypothetical protein
MAYATGVSTDVGDLAGKVIAFLVANGFAEADSGSRSATEDIAILTKGGKTYGLVNSKGANPVKYISLAIGTGYADAGGHPELTDGCTYQRTTFVTEPFVEHHFFYSDDEFFAVVEHQAGRYRHFGLGVVEKFGSYTGGEFVTGHAWNTGSVINNESAVNHAWPFRAVGGSTAGSGALRVDLTTTPQYKYFSSTNVLTLANSSYISLLWGANSSNLPSRDAVNNFNGESILQPIYVYAYDGTALYYSCGYVETVRGIWLDNHNAKDIKTLGADDWMIFPLTARQGPATTENSGLRGFAYKKVA